MPPWSTPLRACVSSILPSESFWKDGLIFLSGAAVENVKRLVTKPQEDNGVPDFLDATGNFLTFNDNKIFDSSCCQSEGFKDQSCCDLAGTEADPNCDGSDNGPCNPGVKFDESLRD